MPKRLRISFTLDAVDVEMFRAVSDFDGLSSLDDSQVAKLLVLRSLADAVSFDSRVPVSHRVLRRAMEVSGV